MRRGLVALLAAGVTAALVPTAAPAAAAGTDWSELLRRDISAHVQPDVLAGAAEVSAEAAGAGPTGPTEASAQAAGADPTGPAEPTGPADGVYGQDCTPDDPSALALRGVTVTLASGAARFTADGCDRWSTGDLAGGSVAWRLAVPGGAGDADFTIAVVDERLGAVVTGSDGEVVLTSEARLDENGGLSVTVPLEAIGGHRAFGLIVTTTDAAGRGDALTGRDGRPLLFPSTPESAVAGTYTVAVETDRFDSAVREARAAGWSLGVQSARLGLFDVEAADEGRLGVLRSLPGVSDVSRTAPVTLTQTPTAVNYPDQWALSVINAPTAWRVRDGSGRTVAVVDSGVDGTRADLAGRVLEGWDTWNGVPLPAGGNSDWHRPTTGPPNGHGTAVAGIIAADADHDIAGVDWTARILPYRVTNSQGVGPVTAVADAIVRAADAGADVVNLSLGVGEDQASPEMLDVLRHAVRYATDRGVVLVAASGNRGPTGARMYPAAFPEVLAVSATQRDDRIATYSSIGDHIHVAAPGGQGAGPDRSIVSLGNDGGSYTWAGTSFAAPHVTGAASLYLAGHPSASPGAVASALASAAVDAGPAGWDPTYGHGILDVGTLVASQPSVEAATARACPPAQVTRPRFHDVFTNSHYEAIACLSWWNVTDGVTPTTYVPSADVRRGQMASFLVELLRQTGADLPADADQGFTDVAGTTHATSINQLAALGIASGTTTTTFSPDARVTRDQMATFIVNAHRVASGAPLPPGDGAQFTDIRGNRHEQAITTLASAGVVTGTGGTTYDPRRAVTRAQMASFLMREANLLVEGGHAAPPDR